MMRCSKPSITKIERKFIEDALNKNDIGVGEYIGKFEKAWAKYNGTNYGVACNSCTNALYLALKALGIGPGDEVIVPEFTMIATAWAVSYTGATPVFVDCKNDLTIDETKILITPKTKAIMPVHIYGRKCNMTAINTLAKKNKLWVIEDMAEAHGIIPSGDVACYSFYGNKILTTGEGGMCLTNDSKTAEEIRLLANMYFDKGRTLLHPKIGHNFRLTNIQAAIGYGQALRVEKMIKKRNQIAGWYDLYLDKKFLMPKREVVWMYDIDCGEEQEKIKAYLDKNNIESRYFFKPMSMQPMYEGKFEELNAYKWSKQGLYLPTYFDMTKKDVMQVAKLINECSRITSKTK
jgi:dTDP-4-amino-4,6-dideoxygalactose transaminase